MSILPINLARVSNLLRTSAASQQIAQTQLQLLQVQQELSSGQRLNAPSDDPGDSSLVLQLQKTLDDRQAYAKNLQQAQSQLGEVDSTLGNLTDLVQQAMTIASQNVDSTVSPDQRKAAAAVVDSLYQQAISLGNTQFDGSFIFGGDKSTTAPFVAAAGGVQFVGSAGVLQNVDDQNTVLPFQVSGATVFGALSSRVTGTADLTPALTPATRLSDLRGAGGTGVQLGSILLGNGTATKLVDLSHADSVQGVVNAIDAAGLGGITASISGNHLVLSTSSTDNISVSDVGGGTTAADLGIRRPSGAGAGAALVGQSVQPRITALTPLAALKSGAGIDQSHGLIITNGQNSATVSFTSAATVEDLLNAINASGTHVQAQINASGDGIDILNPVQGTQMTIAENGGTTASDLGVRSFSPASLLSELNGGKGIGLATGGPDFQITRSDGTSFTVALAGAKTVQDVIDRINSASAGIGLTASFSTTGNGIVLTDTAGGGNSPSISSLNFSSAVADLGLSVSATGSSIHGTDVDSVAVSGLFGNLAKLRDALNANDTAGITAAGQALQSDHDRVVVVRGQAGALVQQMQSRQNSLGDQNTATQALLSQLKDTDFPATIEKFTTLQTSLQATLQTTARSLNLSLLDFLG